MINDLIVRVLTWLAYESGLLTVRFQRAHLIANYSLLGLALVIYGLGIVGATIIVLACLPGALIFVASLEALAWKLSNDSANDLQVLIQNLLANIK